MIRPATALGVAASTAAVAGWMAPALLRARVLRAAVRPGLAGVGRSDSVALTFDDGPDPQGTPAVLDALARLGWTATFFMLGGQVARLRIRQLGVLDERRVVEEQRIEQVLDRQVLVPTTRGLL